MPTDPRTGKPLLDTVCDRFDDDAKRRVVGVDASTTASDDQLSLFDVSEDGTTMVAFDGQTL